LNVPKTKKQYKNIDLFKKQIAFKLGIFR